MVQERYDNYIATTQAQIASLKAEDIEQLEKLQHTISEQHKQLVSLRIQYRSQLRKNQRERLNQEATRVAAVRGRKKLAGGNSRPTLIKLAKAVKNSLNFLFSTPHTQQAALYQHFPAIHRITSSSWTRLSTIRQFFKDVVAYTQTGCDRISKH